MTIDRASLLPQIVRIAEQAGQAIMAIYHDESAWQIQNKEDNSPVTAADVASNQLIVAQLKALTPDIPVISEEGEQFSFEERKNWPRCWLVDPLDGTKEFVARNGEFSVNIALVENHQATLGVIYSPVKKMAYMAAKGLGAFCQQAAEKKAIHAADFPDKDYRLVVSRRHLSRRNEKFVQSVEQALGAVILSRAGSAFKICAVAEGKADAYPRFGNTMEWDTAAGQIIVEEAGGALVDKAGNPFRYNERPTLLNNSFLITGKKVADWLPVWLEAQQE